MHDFTKITEAPSQKATAEQLGRLGQRYQFALTYGKGGRVLEVACGTGIGLGYLSLNGKSSVFGGDLEIKNLIVAKRVVPSDRTVFLTCFDAQFLPFNNSSFDTVVCFEAIYYFPDPEQFVAEVIRVLRPEGILILGTVNYAWQDFHPSSYTHRYFNNVELFQLLNPHFGKVDLYGGFPAQQAGLRAKVISTVKHVAITAHLIPGSLAARAYLKRIFLGRTTPIPDQIREDMVPAKLPIPISSDNVNKEFKILYAVAVREEAKKLRS